MLHYGGKTTQSDSGNIKWVKTVTMRFMRFSTLTDQIGNDTRPLLRMPGQILCMGPTSRFPNMFGLSLIRNGLLLLTLVSIR